VIRRYYGGSILALLLIPVVVLGAAGLFNALDPERARGHADYARHFLLLQHLRVGSQLAMLGLAGVLWLMACAWLVCAKARQRAWTSLALLGPLGFALLSALADRSPPVAADRYRNFLARLPFPLRLGYEAVRFAAFGFVALQLVEWLDSGTALLEATRRGVSLATILAERDASSGMWAFGDSLRAAYPFVLLYALWPAGFNAVAKLIRPTGPRAAAG